MVSPTATRVPACGETERSVTKSKENKEGRPAELGWAARTKGKRPRPAAERPPPHSPWPRPPLNARRRAERAGAAARRKARHCTTAAVRRGGAARFVVERFCAPWANCADVPERIWRHRSVLWKCSLLSQPCPVPLLFFSLRAPLPTRRRRFGTLRRCGASPALRAPLCAPTWPRFGISLLKIATK